MAAVTPHTRRDSSGAPKPQRVLDLTRAQAANGAGPAAKAPFPALSRAARRVLGAGAVQGSRSAGHPLPPCGGCGACLVSTYHTADRGYDPCVISNRLVTEIVTKTVHHVGKRTTSACPAGHAESPPFPLNLNASLGVHSVPGEAVSDSDATATLEGGRVKATREPGRSPQGPPWRPARHPRHAPLQLTSGCS